MKKIKKNKKARLDACSEKVRSVFYGELLQSGDMSRINEFNSEWSDLASLFGRNMISLKDYEKKVHALCTKWSSKSSIEE